MRGNKKSARNHATGLLIAILAVVACHGTIAIARQQGAAKSYELSREQQVLLLSEANAAYSEGAKLETNDAAAAMQNFEAAAEKYQLIASSGVKNSRLFANLGNAYFKAGQLGKAIANYRRSLQLDPTNRVSRENLQIAEQVLDSRANASQADASATRPSKMLANIVHWLRSYLGPRVVFAVGIFAWIALCGVIAARLFTSRLPWKSLAAAAIILAMAATGFFFGSSRVGGKHLTVVVAPNTTAYEADGRNFPVAGMRLREGELVEQLKARSDWVQIRNAAGQTGWIARSDAEPI